MNFNIKLDWIDITLLHHCIVARAAIQANDTKDIAEMIVELAGNGLKIFESSKPLAKNQFLKILVSNCILDNKKS